MFASWVDALFDRSSEGIEDHLLRYVAQGDRLHGLIFRRRTTKPFTLFHLAPSLVSYAISAMHARMIDPEVWRTGLSFFQSELLNWTLIGVINGLTAEIVRHGSVLLCVAPRRRLTNVPQTYNSFAF